jgi:hypothetical protein
MMFCRCHKLCMAAGGREADDTIADAEGGDAAAGGNNRTGRLTTGDPDFAVQRDEFPEQQVGAFYRNEFGPDQNSIPPYFGIQYRPVS